MDKQYFPILDKVGRAVLAKNMEDQGSVMPEFHSNNELMPGMAAVAKPKISKPVSSMMARNLWTVDEDDTVEMVEETLERLGCASAPVMGSNGVIVGVIGSQELAHFLSENKNAKTVRAWEISRCTTFEVAPGDTIEDVSILMTENKIEYIAVTELGVLKGVVSTLDMLKEIINLSR